jgi:Mitochondrial carrier protein
MACKEHTRAGHVVQGLPYDVAELTVYRAASRCLGRPLTPAWFQEHGDVTDALSGAAAGAAAVLASAPFDCLKMRLATLSPALVASAADKSTVQLWLLTAQLVLRKHGVGRLFVGTAARLCEVVPGTMAYCVAVEAAQRALEPFIADPG